jgi:N-acetylglutamate synthase-like GNAT family acetyltransferase
MASLMVDIQLRSFRPGDDAAFRALNEDWILKYFAMEEADQVVLGDPVGQILKQGGHIFMAMAKDRAIGCCALLAMGGHTFELAKMAVMEDYRGQGIGRELLHYAIKQAKALGATRLFLGSNSKLANAIHLYESVGFRHVPPERLGPSHYARANVFMEMLL